MCLHVLSNHSGTFCPHVMQIFSILKEQLLLSIPVPPDSFTSSSSSANATIGAPYWEPVAVKQDWRLKWRESYDAERGCLLGEMRAGDTDRWKDAGWQRHLTRREEESWGRDEGNDKQTGWKQIKLILPNAMSQAADMCSVEGRLKFCQITYKVMRYLKNDSALAKYHVHNLARELRWQF